MFTVLNITGKSTFTLTGKKVKVRKHLNESALVEELRKPPTGETLLPCRRALGQSQMAPMLTVLVALLEEFGWLRPLRHGKGGRGEQGAETMMVTQSPMLE